MNPRSRIIALRLVQRIKQNPEYAKKIGVEAKFLIFLKEKNMLMQHIRYKSNVTL